jgi:hypothetical protein
MLTIEQGWLSLIDGLTVQRYFLHTYPYILEQLKKEIDLTQYVVNRNPVYETINEYAIHFLDQEEDYNQVSFKDKVWLVTGDYDESSTGKFYQSLDLIYQTGLYFIPELASGVVNFNPKKSGKTHFCLRFDLNNANDVVTGAMQILEESSESLAKAFIESYHLSLPQEKYYSPWEKRSVNIYQIIIDIFRASILVDFSNRAKIDLENIYPHEKDRLNQIKPILPEILSKINHMNIDDLIKLYLPGQQRFKKYLNGKGAGQT